MNRSMLTLTAMVTLSLFFSSCSKLDDYIPEPGGKKKPKDCRITQIRLLQPSGLVWDTLDFHYSAGSILTNITRRPGPRTGGPGYQFIYANGLLTDVIEYYENGGFENWHRYKYNSSGTLILDSLYTFGTITPQGPALAIYRRAIQPVFDNKGRVTKDIISEENGPAYNWLYAYDNKGNLLGPNYDNKQNFYQTDPILMLYGRNYSKNNPFKASAYNSAGYPTSIHLTAGNVSKFFENYFTDAFFTYDCDKVKK